MRKPSTNCWVEKERSECRRHGIGFVPKQCRFPGLPICQRRTQDGVLGFTLPASSAETWYWS